MKIICKGHKICKINCIHKLPHDHESSCESLTINWIEEHPNCECNEKFMTTYIRKEKLKKISNESNL